MTASPGWYSDPGGAPGQWRYWDGRRWSPTTSTNPYATPPGGAPQPRKGATGWWILAVIVGAVIIGLIVWLAVGRPQGSLPEDKNSSSPTVSAWDERLPTKTPPPVSAPPGGTMVECPMTAELPTAFNGSSGWMTSGGIKAKTIPGWRSGGISMGWVHDLQAQRDTVKTAGPITWFSMTGVGALSVGDGFDDPHTSAFQVMSCFATSQYYSGYTGRSDLFSEAVTVNGRPAWHLRSEVRVVMKEMPDVKGDWVDVIVVDTGHPESLGVFISSVTIDDGSRLGLVDDVINSLTTA